MLRANTLNALFTGVGVVVQNARGAAEDLSDQAGGGPHRERVRRTRGGMPRIGNGRPMGMRVCVWVELWRCRLWPPLALASSRPAIDAPQAGHHRKRG